VRKVQFEICRKFETNANVNHNHSHILHSLKFKCSIC